MVRSRACQFCVFDCFSSKALRGSVFVSWHWTHVQLYVVVCLHSSFAGCATLVSLVCDIVVVFSYSELRASGF